MENLNLADLNLSLEESRDIIEFLAKKRNINNYKRKSSNELLRAIKENKNNQQQKNKSNNKKRIDIIKELSYKLSKSELKEIKKNLYNIEKRNQFESKETNKYLDELDKKNLKLDKYHYHDDCEYRRIKNIHNLFKLSIDKDYYKPILAKSGYNTNYIQYESKGDKILTLKEYLALTERYLRKLINYYKNKGEWKLQLTAEISFISSKPGSDETRVMHTKSDNEEIMNGSDTDGIIEGLFESFLQKYEENLQEKIKGSEFEFDGLDFLYYDFNKISIDRGGSYIDSPKWIRNKKSTINPKNNDYKCFQYAVTLALNLDKINNHPERVSKIKPFIDQYNWNEIDFPSTSKDWKKFELNNEIARNILYVAHNTKKIHVAYKSKHNLIREKQVILLMISNGENWHYIVVKSLPGLLKGITSSHNEDFYCLNYFCAYTTKNKLQEHKNISENNKYCHVEMPNEETKIVKYNQGEKSIKSPFIIYANLECLFEKMNTCYNNPEESSTTEINKHTPSGYSLFTHCSFDKTKNKLDNYRGEDCIKKFCKDLREHATKMINYEKKKRMPLKIKEEICHNKIKNLLYMQKRI